MLDSLADAVEEHLDTATLLRLADHGAPADLPFVRCLNDESALFR
jgi:adenosylcobyric acid synthase